MKIYFFNHLFDYNRKLKIEIQMNNIKLEISILFIILSFKLNAQIKLLDIVKNNNIKTINDFPEANIKNEAIIYSFHSIVFDKLIIESNDLINNKLSYIFLRNNENMKSLLKSNNKFYIKDSFAMVYDIDKSNVLIFKLIDSNLFEFDYNFSVENERISNCYVYNSSIFILTTQKNNNTIKLYSINKNLKELKVEIEDPFYKLFLSISEKSNYEFFQNLLVFRDYSNSYFKVFDLNKTQYEKYIYQYQNDTNLLKTKEEIDLYKRYNSAKYFISASDRLSARNYLNSLYCLDSVIIIKTSANGKSNYNDNFAFIYKYHNNQFKLIQQYNPSFPIEKQYLNQKMNYNNFCHLFSDHKTLIYENSLIVCIKNIQKEDLNNQFTLTEIFNKINNSDESSPINFIIYKFLPY